MATVREVRQHLLPREFLPRYELKGGIRSGRQGSSSAFDPLASRLRWLHLKKYRSHFHVCKAA